MTPVTTQESSGTATVTTVVHPITITGIGQQVKIVSPVNTVRIVAGGPRGAKGDKGDPGVQGPVNSGEIWVQGMPEKVWHVTHSLPYHPAVVVLDSSDRVVEVEVQYGDIGSLTIVSLAAFSGRVLMR